MPESFSDAINRLTVITAPEFHLVIQEGSNGEVYNMAIRGPSQLILKV